MVFVCCNSAVGLFKVIFVYLNPCLGEKILQGHHIEDISHHRNESPICVPVWQCCLASPSAEENNMGFTHEHLVNFLLNRDFNTFNQK